MWRIKALKRYVPLQARKRICILMPTSHLLTPSTHCVLLHHVIFWLLYSTAHVMLTPSYQRTAVSRSSLSVPECPFLPPTCKWSWFVPMDFKEPWRISLKEVTSSIHQNYASFPFPHFRDRQCKSTLRVPCKTRHNMKNLKHCYSHLPSRDPQWFQFHIIESS